MVFVFLCLTYVFSIVPSRYIYIVTNGTISFSLWLSHAPLCVCVCVCVCVYIPWLLYPFTCQQTFRSFPHLLLWIRLLWVWGMHVFFWVSVFIFPDKYLVVELLDHVVAVLLLIFWGTSILFSIVAIPIYIPLHSTQKFPFLYILVSICCLFSFG